MSKPVEIQSSVTRIPTPGQLLREKREEYGWSAKDVAGALRLSESQIEAIESDDYERLPGKTYVMGYWRSYSQLLKISIDDSIHIHRADLTSGVGEIALEPSHQQVRGSEEKSRKRAALVFACLLAIFLGAVWYWQDPDASIRDWVSTGLTSFKSENAVVVNDGEPIEPLSLPEPSVTPDEQQSVLALPEPNFSLGQQAVDINTRGYEVLITELPLSRRDLIYLPFPEVPEGEVTGGEAAASATLVQGTQRDSAEQKALAAAKQVEQARLTAARTAAAAKTAAAKKAASTGGNRVIAFQVAKESWIDVRDGTGERLIYRTVNRGEDIQLRGNPPYSVFIGSAEGVKVQYQGKEVPFKVHESGLFARFEVGSAQ